MRPCSSEASACQSAPDRVKSSPSSRRLTHIDALRGLLLLMMAINHIPSDLRVVTDHALGFVSAAEGFVFLAGLMAGYVYARLWIKTDFQGMVRGCVQRAVTIYRWHVLAYVAVFAGLLLFGFYHHYLPANTPASFLLYPQLSFLAGPLLLNQPALFDILPMYCVFLLTTPWCLRACQRGHSTLLVCVSLGLWVVINLFCAQQSFERGPINAGAFNLAAWQLLFVTGLCFGHRWAAHSQETREKRSSSPLLPMPSRPLLTGLLIATAALFCLRRGFLDTGLPEPVIEALTNKNNLAPLRLLNATLLFYLTYLVLSRHPHLLSWRPLAWLGRCSLTVFTTHVLVTYAIQAYPEVFAETVSGRWLGTSLMIISLFAGAGLHTLCLKKTAHHRRSPASPRAIVPLHPAPSLSRWPHVRPEEPRVFGWPYRRPG